MTEKKRSKSKKTVRHLRLVPPSRESTAAAKDAPVQVPQVDATGARIPELRVALWHLISAETLLAAEFRRERSTNRVRARAIEQAFAVVRQVHAVLDENFRAMHYDGGTLTPIEVDRDSLTRMAAQCQFRLTATKKRAETWLLSKLPSTPAEARVRFPDHPTADAFSADGAANLARCALLVLSSQRHDDAMSVLRRWSVSRAEDALNSPKFEEDAGALASEVRLLWSVQPATIGEPFNRALIRRAYRLLGLKHPFEAADRHRRRRGKSKHPKG